MTTPTPTPDNGRGLLSLWLEKVFGKNYRTTLTGWSCALLTLVAFLSAKPALMENPVFPSALKNIVLLVGSILLAMLPAGSDTNSVVVIFATLAAVLYGVQSTFQKDKSVTGGTVAATPEAVERVSGEEKK